jgi:hypothetical protein
MDLVEEQDRALIALAQAVPGSFDRLADVLHARRHGRHLFECPRGRSGDGQRQRRLPGAGRAPEDRRCQAVLLDQPSQWSTGTDEMVLTDDIVDGPRAQPGGERCRRA